MKATTINPYKIFWGVLIPSKGAFNKHIEKFLNKNGATVWDHKIAFILSPAPEKLFRIKSKIESYKKKPGIISFKITDKQFGLQTELKKWSGLQYHYRIGNDKRCLNITHKQAQKPIL